MLLSSEWQSYWVEANVLLCWISNLSLLYLVHSDRQPGKYRRILSVIGLFNIYYGTVHGVIDLVRNTNSNLIILSSGLKSKCLQGVLVDARGFLLFSKFWSRFGYWSGYVAVLVYLNSFSQSITLLAVHCLFRYSMITR